MDEIKKPTLEVLSNDQPPEVKEPEWAEPDFDKELTTNTRYDSYIVRHIKMLRETSKPRLLDPLFLAIFGLATIDSPESRGIRRRVALELGWKDTRTERKQFEMGFQTQLNLKAIVDVAMLKGYDPRKSFVKMKDFWLNVSKELGFINGTQEPIKGQPQHVFTAEVVIVEAEKKDGDDGI